MIQVIHMMIYIPKIIKQSRFSIYIAILHGLLICNIVLNLNGYLYMKEPRALWSILHNQLLPLYPNATPIPFVSNAPPLLQYT